MDIVSAIEKKLGELLQNPDQETSQHSLFTAARYAALSSGKRLRPLLASTVAQCYGNFFAIALIPICALELIHTYSLIHDDLPCMDNDDMRRGQPSLHKVFGEGHALLTGDFLLTYSFDLLANAPDLNSEKKIALIAALAQAAGSTGMIGGQVMDLLYTQNETPPQIDKTSLLSMHGRKTAALFSASFLFGGIIADAPQEDLNLLQQAGFDFGLAFQIFDDIADVSDSSELLKATAVTTLGLEPARLYTEEILDKALHCLTKLSIDASQLRNLIQKIIHSLKLHV